MLQLVREIDRHAHVLDPSRFPYGDDVPYKPTGQEIGTRGQLLEVVRAYGVRHVLLVQPNSGYGHDNSCMLNAIAHSPDVFKGIAITDLKADLETLRQLKDRGVIGFAVNPSLYGTDQYAHFAWLIEKIAELDMFLQIHSEHDQLLAFLPWIEAIPVRVLIDHCGRPTPDAGLVQPGFEALLRLASTGRVHVKLSGHSKFSKTDYPFDDTWPFVRALVDAFTPAHCLWASHWPFLRATSRQDYGPLVDLSQLLFRDPTERRSILWDTPRRLFGFD